MNILITGSNRGIGLEFVRQYAEAGETIHACCRKPEKADKLKQLAQVSDRIKIHILDVTHQDSVDQIAHVLKDTPIDLLINNAGISGNQERQNINDMDYDSWAKTLAINSMAPLRMIQAFQPHLKKSGSGAKIITISSLVGALNHKMGGDYAYRSSKAAINKIMQLIAIDFEKDGIIACPVHPGWVRTDMGGYNADISVEESVTGLRQVINKLTIQDSGRFWQYDGKELDW